MLSGKHKLWERTHFRGKCYNADNEIALSQHPAKRVYFLNLLICSQHSPSFSSLEAFFLFLSGVLKLLVC